MKIFNGFKARVFLVLLFVFLVFLYIIGHLFYVQIVKGNEWKETGERQYKSEHVIKSKRGKIITNDEEILAYDGESYSITLDPTLVILENIDNLMGLLKKHIPEFNSEKVKKEILEKRKQNKKYMKIENIIDYKTKKLISDDQSKDVNLKSGVFFETNFIRNYIKNNAFQEIVGYLDNENKGVYGIEKYYDENLIGVDGLIEGFRIPRNFFSIPSLRGRKEAVSARDGHNIVLTIDSVIQYTMDEEMKKAFEEYNAVSTMGILIEVETGKILAMSSYPKASNNAEVKNRPITDLFEPGSIFKPVTISMGLQSGVINANSTIQSNGYIKVADRTIRDHDGSTTGDLTLEKLIANSGNVGMVKIAQMIKNNEFYDYLKNIGFGSKTEIDTFSESTQKLFNQKEMSEVKKANISFGQGIAMTQMQMLMALNTVINDGKLMKPYLVEKIVDGDNNIIEQNSSTVLKTVFSEEVSRLNRQYMEAVVTKGTGRGVQIPGYRIGGKTGTAQKSGNRGYEAGKYFSSFFAFFPVDSPKYAILITVNEPKGAYYGAAVALPPVKSVLEKLIKYKGINPEGIVKNTNLVRQTKNKAVKKDLSKIKNEFNDGVMPDLTEISLREFISVYPHQKFSKYKVSGSGKVKSQFPLPGVKITKDSEIKINLE
ncbi:MAG: peptidoglycan glycosyltransferase [Leptotrichiaceae bacterium]|nr:peptidoglycan glycosyltransferase [Leptotrichiaceae bacterium]